MRTSRYTIEVMGIPVVFTGILEDDEMKYKIVYNKDDLTQNNIVEEEFKEQINKIFKD